MHRHADTEVSPHHRNPSFLRSTLRVRRDEAGLRRAASASPVADFTFLRHIKSVTSTIQFRTEHVARRYGFVRMNRNVFVSC